jgi:hypothetical protein
MGRDTEFNPSEFDDDAAIAAEIRQATEEICYGVVKCVHCGTVFGSCIEVQFQLGGSMLPQARGNAAPSNNGGQQRSKRSGYDWIKEADLTTDKIRCKIIGAQENDQPAGPQRFSDVIVKLAFKGQTRLLGLKDDNPNYGILTSELTYNPNEWAGREIYLFLEGPNFMGRYFIRVELVPLQEPTVDDGEPEPEPAPQAPVVAARKPQPRR